MLHPSILGHEERLMHGGVPILRWSPARTAFHRKIGTPPQETPPHGADAAYFDMS
ncbi:hypothetical protein [Agromyces salentinus]|nr:hypothetical protein [Agromyces salentinus]